MDLQQPERKMSKSEDSPQGTILVLDPPKTIEKKIKSAVTDSGSEVRHDRDDQARRLEPHRDLRRGHRAHRSPTSSASSTGQQYGVFKVAVAEAVVEFLRPVQDRFARARGRPGRDRSPARGGRRRGRGARRSRARPRRARRGPAPPSRWTARTAYGASFQGAGCARSVGQSDLPTTSPRSCPTASSQLAVPPPSAPWITTACGAAPVDVDADADARRREVGLASAAGYGRSSRRTAR